MMKRLFLLLLIIAGGVFVARQVRAATLTVCVSGCDYSSLETAVTAAAPGDILDLAGETFSTNLVIGKSVTLQGEAGTILDGGGSGRVISVTNGVEVSLLNLTVQNGSADDGGGIFNRGDLTLAGVTVLNNTAVSILGSGASFLGRTCLSDCLLHHLSRSISNTPQRAQCLCPYFGSGRFVGFHGLGLWPRYSRHLKWHKLLAISFCHRNHLLALCHWGAALYACLS